MPESHSLFDAAARNERVAAAFGEAVYICQTLRQAGHLAYFAGGCVRDALLGRLPKDFDVATDATPNRVREIFGHKKTLAFGASFGVIAVLPRRPSDDKSAKGSPIQLEATEVATFRSDGTYTDGRRPDEVHFGDAKNDAQRRDFTINGLFYDPAKQEVIDYVGGQEDLKQRRLRTIGLAENRFEEDKLRMLRAIRFATTLGFDLETQTQDEIRRRANEIGVVSPERVGAEMRRVTVSPNLAEGIQRIFDCDLARFVLPGIENCEWLELSNRVNSIKHRAFPVCLAILLQTASGSPQPTLEKLEYSWRLSNEEVRQTKFAIDHWQQIVLADQAKWSTIQPLLINRDAETAIAVAEAVTVAEAITVAEATDAHSSVVSVAKAVAPTDDLAADTQRQRNAGVMLAREAMEWPRERLNPSPLITGDLLRERGYRPGPKFRNWLQSVRDMQLDGKLANQADALAWISEFG